MFDNPKRPKYVREGARYVPGSKEIEIELATGERMKRLKEGYRPGEAARVHVEGGVCKSAVQFPQGFEPLTPKRHPVKGAVPTIFEMRLRATVLFELYVPGYLPDGADKPVPFDPKALERAAEASARRTRLLKLKKGHEVPYGVFYPALIKDDKSEGEKPAFVFDPPFWTTQIVNEHGQRVLAMGWSHSLIVGDRELHRTKDGYEVWFEPKEDTPAYEAGLRAGWRTVLDFRFSKEKNPDEEDEDSGLRNLLGNGFIEIVDGDVIVTPAGRALGITEDRVRANVAFYSAYSPFFTKTSKMGCASWNLPAGPIQAPGLNHAFYGSCPAAWALGFASRIEGYYKDHDRDSSFVKPYLDPLPMIHEKMERSGQALVKHANDLGNAIKDAQANVSKYADRFPPEKGKPKGSPKLICSVCYALKGNYANLNQQVWQAVRFAWTKAAMDHDARGRFIGPVRQNPPTASDKHEKIGRSSYFAAFMTEALRAYYSKDSEEGRIENAEDPHYFRVHDSGDFWSESYYWAWIQVIEQFSCIRFWAPVRGWISPVLVKAFQRRPKNFAVKPSALFFKDPAPEIPGLPKGSTGGSVPNEQGLHWYCPATSNDRASCIGGLSVAHLRNKDLGKFPWLAKLPKWESSCRVCWSGYHYLPEQVNRAINNVGVSYREH